MKVCEKDREIEIIDREDAGQLFEPAADPGLAVAEVLSGQRIFAEKKSGPGSASFSQRPVR